MPGQLVFPFGVQPALGREDFVLAPCNEQAFRFVDRWPDWPARAAAIYGPHGSGKSHLARIWCSRSNGELISARLLTREEAAKFSPDVPVAIEMGDVNSYAPAEERDRAIMAFIERASGQLLFTALTPPADWPVAVPDLRSRFDALLAFPLWAPDDALLNALVGKQFADRQLDVREPVVKRILTHVERTPEAIRTFIARADLKALSERRAITERLVLELIEAEESGRNTAPNAKNS
jgi:chromosomal replication initiation ATPase DnaA